MKFHDIKRAFQESRKFQNDIIYFTQTYCVDFKLNDSQIGYLHKIADGNDSLINESISHIQELNLSFALWKMLVSPYTSIVFMSSDNKTKNLTVQKFREMMDRLTMSSTIFKFVLKCNLKYEIWLPNNSSILFGDYSNFKYKLRGRNFNILILDNFSSFSKQNEFLQFVVPVVTSSKNNKIIGLNNDRT